MIHLIKLCVGADHISDLEAWQFRVATERVGAGLPPHPVHQTRQTPKRADELLDGGSIYWVIRGVIQVRQPILDIHTGTDRNGRAFCELELDPGLVPTEAQGRKAFQGWRYLKPEDAPADLTGSSTGQDVPPELSIALKDAGVW